MKNPFLLLTFASLFWAGNVVISKALATDVPPISLAFMRWSLALFIVIIFSWKKVKQDICIIRKQLLVLLPISFLGITAFNTMIYIALQDTTALNSLLLQSFLPVVVVLISFTFFNERLKKLQVVGILVSLLGTLTLVAKGSISTLAHTGLNRGDLWVIGAIVFYAGYTNLLRFRPQVHPLSFLATTFFLGVVMLLPFFLWEMSNTEPIVWNKDVFITVGYLGIFPSFVAYLFFNYGVSKVGGNIAGLFSHLIPLFGSLMAIFFLGETFYGYHAVGMLFTFSGIYLVIKDKIKLKPKSKRKKLV